MKKSVQYLVKVIIIYATMIYYSIHVVVYYYFYYFLKHHLNFTKLNLQNSFFYKNPRISAALLCHRTELLRCTVKCLNLSSKILCQETTSDFTQTEQQNKVNTDFLYVQYSPHILLHAMLYSVLSFVPVQEHPPIYCAECS